MRSSKSLSLVLVALIATQTVPFAVAQDVAGAVRIEALPAELRARLDESDRALARLAKIGGNPQQQWISLKRWRPGDTVRVCFASGTVQTHQRVAAIAQQWNAVGANVRLDFGALNRPNVCSLNQSYDVRVSFKSGQGDWSLIARESITPTIVSRTAPSMNLEILRDRPLGGGEFAAIVLHEFGHALGLLHEHQNPLSPCANEFNMPLLFATFGAAPYNLSRQEIIFNVAGTNHFTDTFAATRFDPQSIMIYSLPENFYLRGRFSPCFAQNYTLSIKDKESLRLAYGTQSSSEVLVSALLSAASTYLSGRQRDLFVGAVNAAGAAAADDEDDATMNVTGTSGGDAGATNSLTEGAPRNPRLDSVTPAPLVSPPPELSGAAGDQGGGQRASGDSANARTEGDKLRANER